MNHLDPDLLPIAILPIQRRIEYVLAHKWWIEYDRAKDIILSMDRLLLEQRSERMESLLLLGEPGSGKTSILHEFVHQYPATLNSQEDGLNVPVILIEAPAVPDERRFYDRIFRNTQTIYKKNESLSNKHEKVISLLKDIKLKALVIDEVHNIMAGPEYKHKIFLNLLRELSNELQINLIIAGIDSALEAVKTDDQLLGRLSPEVLGRWELAKEETFRFFISVGRRIPLQQASDFTNPKLVKAILDRSEGILGEMVKLLRKSVIYALEHGYEKITPSIIEKAPYISRKQFKELEDQLSDK